MNATEIIRHLNRRTLNNLCRLLGTAFFWSGTAPAQEIEANEHPISDRLSEPTYADLGKDQKLEPLFPEGVGLTMQEWSGRRDALRQTWLKFLGKPSFTDYDKSASRIERFELSDFRATTFRQPTGPKAHQLVLLVEPGGTEEKPRPGAVVPYYHPDAMIGFNLKTRERLTKDPTIQFARHLVQQGYVAVCTEAFPYNTVPEPDSDSGLSWWHAAARKLLEDHPDWTGMGKLVHDTSRAVDLLLEQPNVDADRIAIIGHSLGGKMAFYTGCLDERIKATIATDFGIGWDFTNWGDPWYLGERIRQDGFALAHHQLLALHAPRPFLLIGGEYDKPESWQYLKEAQSVYTIYGARHAVGMIDHASGHQPTEAAMRLAYEWLAEQLGLEPAKWTF